MTRHFLKALISHGIAFGIGLGGAAFLMKHQASSTESHSESQPRQTPRRDRSAVITRLSSPSSYRAAYSTLINRSISKGERNNCLDKLWKQWAASDPESMLTFFENKNVWPTQSSIESLLSDRPDLLLDFVLRCGSRDLIQRLHYGDPVIVARLLSVIPEKEKGAELIELSKHIDFELGKQGIAMSKPNSAYLHGVAQSLLESGHIDEFLKAFIEVGDSKEMRELAEEFGEALTYEKPDEKVFEQLLRLPEEYRKDAAIKLINRGNNYALKYPEVREEHKRWIEKFATEGFFEAAALGVEDLFDKEHAPNRGEEIAVWVARFPPDGSWHPMTEAIMRSWQNKERDGMIQQIGDLPNGPVRNYLATEAAQVTIGGLAQLYDENEQMIYDRMLGLITDPGARNEFEKRFSQKGKSFAEDSDSFASPEDPFASEKDPFAEENE